MPPSPEWRLSQRVTVDMGRLFFGLTFRLRAEGLHHLPAEGGCLLVCNHPTLLDPVLITLVLPREAGHVAEKTPWKYPAVAHFLDLFNVIPVDLKANAAITVKRAVDSLALGRLLCIFAEGKLSDAGQMRRFQPGAARIALEARCPVIPVAVCGTYVAWPRGQATPRFRPVTVRFGAPLDFSRAYPRRRSAGLVRTMTHEMQSAVEALYTPWDPRDRAHRRQP